MSKARDFVENNRGVTSNIQTQLTSGGAITSKVISANTTVAGDSRFETGNDLDIAAAATLTIPLTSLVDVKFYGVVKQL